jgi:polysaccharide transporter, PST family
MTLIKTSLLNGFAVGVRMFTALALNKLLAVYVGPAGYAAIGQFQNVVSMLTTFVTGGMTNGITKCTAENYDDEEKQRRVWRTAAIVTFAGAAIAVLIVVPLRHALAAGLLRDPALSGVFVWLAASLLFLGLNAVLLAILNGKKDVEHYVAANIAGSLLSLALTGVLAWQLGLYGALVALSINQSAAFFVTLYLCRRTVWFRLRNFRGRFDSEAGRELAKFAVMGATTAIVVPVSQILIRDHLRVHFGWDYAGCWDAMARISTMYLALVTTTLSLYYLPRIAEIRGRAELRREIVRVAKLALPATAAAALTIYLFRGTIVTLLFTGRFAPMEQLFAFQMMGDVVKIASWIVAFVMVGRAMTGWFVATEIAAAAMYWGLTVVLTHFIGFRGAALAYLVDYVLYFGTVYWIVIINGTSTIPRRE